MPSFVVSDEIKKLIEFQKNRTKNIEAVLQGVTPDRAQLQGQVLPSTTEQQLGFAQEALEQRLGREPLTFEEPEKQRVDKRGRALVAGLGALGGILGIRNAQSAALRVIEGEQGRVDEANREARETALRKFSEGQKADRATLLQQRERREGLFRQLTRETAAEALRVQQELAQSQFKLAEEIQRGQLKLGEDTLIQRGKQVAARLNLDERIFTENMKPADLKKLEGAFAISTLLKNQVDEEGNPLFDDQTIQDIAFGEFLTLGLNAKLIRETYQHRYDVSEQTAEAMFKDNELLQKRLDVFDDESRARISVQNASAAASYASAARSRAEIDALKSAGDPRDLLVEDATVKKYQDAIDSNILTIQEVSKKIANLRSGFFQADVKASGKTRSQLIGDLQAMNKELNKINSNANTEIIRIRGEGYTVFEAFKDLESQIGG